MGTVLIDGKAVARRVRDEVARDVAELVARTGRQPGLATVLVGSDPASEVYVANKRGACVEAGMADHHRHLSGDATEADVIAVLDELAQDPAVSGILLQLPLPAPLRAEILLARIPAEKDVDGLTVNSAGRLTRGVPGLRPCTPSGVIALLDAYDVTITGALAVVVGRSDLVGKPMGQLLLERDATVVMCHSRTHDLDARCREADILVAAAGVPRLIGASAIKPGAAVIDVGIHRTDDGLCGDVDSAAVAETAGLLTPVPGGVGPMTIALLLRNTYTAAAAQARRVP